MIPSVLLDTGLYIMQVLAHDGINGTMSNNRN